MEDTPLSPISLVEKMIAQGQKKHVDKHIDPLANLWSKQATNIELNKLFHIDVMKNSSNVRFGPIDGRAILKGLHVDQYDKSSLDIPGREYLVIRPKSKDTADGIGKEIDAMSSPRPNYAYAKVLATSLLHRRGKDIDK